MLPTSLGFPANVVALLLTAWLMLGVDAGLKLGIVDRLAALAKGIRELK